MLIIPLKVPDNEQYEAQSKIERILANPIESAHAWMQSNLNTDKPNVNYRNLRPTKEAWN